MTENISECKLHGFYDQEISPACPSCTSGQHVRVVEVTARILVQTPVLGLAGESAVKSFLDSMFSTASLDQWQTGLYVVDWEIGTPKQGSIDAYNYEQGNFLDNP